MRIALSGRHAGVSPVCRLERCSGGGKAGWYSGRCGSSSSRWDTVGPAENRVHGRGPIAMHLRGSSLASFESRRSKRQRRLLLQLQRRSCFHHLAASHIYGAQWKSSSVTGRNRLYRAHFDLLAIAIGRHHVFF